MGITTNAWPVNEKGEIVSDVGTGTRNIVGYLQQDQIPVSPAGALSIAPAIRKSWEVIANSGASSTVTGTTVETPAATITIPAGLLRENSVIKVTAIMKVQTAADAAYKSYTMRYGDTGGFAASQQFFAAGVTAVDSAVVIGHVFCRNSKTSQISGLRNSYAGIGHTTNSADLVTTSYNTNLDTFIYICLDPANVNDIMVLESYVVEAIL